MLLSPRMAAARKPDREQLSSRYGRMDFETPPGAATLTVVVVYVPHQQRVDPSQAEVMDELEQMVLDVPRSHALLVLGDFNAQMGRFVDQVTAQWCVRREAPDAAGKALEAWR